jgi:hypothetical protein
MNVGPLTAFAVANQRLGETMVGFEQGFADTERAAVAASKSAAAVAKSARALERAAKTGNLNAIRRVQADLNAALSALTQEVENTAQAWPFQPGEEEAYLKDHFAAELQQIANGRGLDIQERDERLIAHPSILRVLPANRAVRIDRKQVSTIRPGYLVNLLRENQKKPARFNGSAFLEAVYKAYRMRAGGHFPDKELGSDQSPVVPLVAIYEALTLLPGTGRDYSRTEFALNLYRLDTDGPKATRSGARLHLHGGRQSPISLVAPDGHLLTYHNIAFSEVGNG